MTETANQMCLIFECARFFGELIRFIDGAQFLSMPKIMVME